jgi:hypothetical protein
MLWTLALALPPALAADDAPTVEPPRVAAARVCADAASGTEVEVCLKLAAENPDQTDAISAALRAHIDRDSSPDRELMLALLDLLSTEVDIATRGTRTLAALDDPRAIGPLVHAVEQRETPIALAAIDALATYPGGGSHLARWILDRGRSNDVRVRAAIALGQTGREDAADALIDSLRRKGLPGELRDAILATLRLNHPDRLDEVVRQISRDGTPWLTTTGAVSLGYTMAVAGRFGQPELAAIGAVAGLVAGGTVGYLAAQALPTEAADAAFISVNGVVGTAAGLSLGLGLDRDGLENAGLAGVVGNAAGLTLGVVLAPLHPGSVGDSLEAGLIGLATAGIVGGALDVGRQNGLSDPDRTGRSPALIGVSIGLLAGTTFGHALAPGLRFEGQDWALIGLSTGVGAALGTFAPLAGNARGALPAVGTAAGLLAGIALAGTVDPTWDALGSGGGGALYGGLILGGTAEWITQDPQLTGAGILVGGVLGMGLGGLLADIDQDPIDDRDVVLIVFATGWSAAVTGGVQEQVTGSPFSRLGPLLVVPSVTGAVVSALVPVLDVPVTHSSAATSLGLVGAYVGGTTGEVVADDPVLGALIGGNVALVTGSLLVSPFIGLPPTTVAMADAVGIVGAAGGFVVARLVNDDPDTQLIGGLVGAGVGFLGGAITGDALRRSGRTRNIAFAPRLPEIPGTVVLAPGIVPGAESAAVGAILTVEGW